MATGLHFNLSICYYTPLNSRIATWLLCFSNNILLQNQLPGTKRVKAASQLCALEILTILFAGLVWILDQLINYQEVTDSTRLHAVC